MLEQIFNKIATENMKAWNIESFKKHYPSLFKTIMLTCQFFNSKNSLTEEQKLENLKITGFATPEELSAYEKGRIHEEAAIAKFIENWNGEVNSEMGSLLFNKSVKNMRWFVEKAKDCELLKTENLQRYYVDLGGNRITVLDDDYIIRDEKQVIHKTTFHELFKDVFSH